MNIGGSGGRLDEATRGELARVQAALVRLYFSDRLQAIYRADREVFFQHVGVSARFARFFPDIEQEPYRAECRGRRTLIAREVAQRYPRTLEHLLGPLPKEMTPRCNIIAVSGLFTEFLGSENFLSARYSLPHCYGLGVGYEAVTKFFFWLVERERLTTESASPALRTCAFVEVGRQLVGAAESAAAERLFARFERGLHFRVHVGAPRPLIHIASNGNVRLMADVDDACAQSLDMDAFVRDVRASFHEGGARQGGEACPSALEAAS